MITIADLLFLFRFQTNEMNLQRIRITKIDSNTCFVGNRDFNCKNMENYDIDLLKD